MSIYPNPAQGNLAIDFPQYLINYAKGSGLTTNTIYYQWASTTLEVYALNGSQMLKMEIPKSQSHLELDVSLWLKGLYLFRLMYNNDQVAGEKVLIH